MVVGCQCVGEYQCMNVGVGECVEAGCHCAGYQCDLCQWVGRCQWVARCQWVGVDTIGVSECHSQWLVVSCRCVQRVVCMCGE